VSGYNRLAWDDGLRRPRWMPSPTLQSEYERVPSLRCASRSW